MAEESRTIHVAQDSELARLLEEAKGAPLRLEKDGVTYRLSREDDDPWAQYDPEAVRAGMHAVAGHLSANEADELKHYIYRAREEGSRPADRP